MTMNIATISIVFIIALMVVIIFAQTLSEEDVQRVPEIPGAFILMDVSTENVAIHSGKVSGGYEYDLQGIPINIRYTGNLLQEKRLAMMVSFKGADARAEITGGDEGGKYVIVKPENPMTSFQADVFNLVSKEPPIINEGDINFEGELEEGGAVYLAVLDDDKRTNFTVKVIDVNKKIFGLDAEKPILNRFATCVATLTVECAVDKKILKLKEISECESEGKYRDCIYNKEMCGGIMYVKMLSTDCEEDKIELFAEIRDFDVEKSPKPPFLSGEEIKVTFWEIENNNACIDEIDSVDEMKIICSDRFLGAGTLLVPLAT